MPVCHQITLCLLIELKLRGQALPLFNAMALFPLASKGGGTLDWDSQRPLGP